MAENIVSGDGNPNLLKVNSDGSINTASTYEYIDLVNNPSTVWELNSDGQASSETITLDNGDIYKRTFTYTDTSNGKILTERSKWVKQ